LAVATAIFAVQHATILALVLVTPTHGAGRPTERESTVLAGAAFCIEDSAILARSLRAGAILTKGTLERLGALGAPAGVNVKDRSMLTIGQLLGTRNGACFAASSESKVAGTEKRLVADRTGSLHHADGIRVAWLFDQAQVQRGAVFAIAREASLALAHVLIKASLGASGIRVTIVKLLVLARIDLNTRFAVSGVSSITHARACARASESAVGMGRATGHILIAVVDSFAYFAVACVACNAHASVVTRTGPATLGLLGAATIGQSSTHVHLTARPASARPAFVAIAGICLRASVDAGGPCVMRKVK
jgi:hypothetical protein